MPRVLLELTGNYVRRSCYAVLLLFGVSGGCWMFTPKARSVYVHPTTSLAIDAACDKVIAALPGQTVDLERTLILPLANDRVDANERELVTEALREKFSQHGVYRPVDESRTDKLRKWVANTLNISALKSKPVEDAETALKYAEWAEAGFVVFGRVLKLQQPTDQSTGGQALVEFRIRLFDATSGMCLVDKTFSSAPDSKPETALNRLGTAPTQRWYGASVVFFAAVWPLALTSLMRRVLLVENNQLTLFTLLVIIAVPVALGWPWAFGASAGVWRSIFYFVGAALVALWCSFVMSRVAELNKY